MGVRVGNGSCGLSDVVSDVAQDTFACTARYYLAVHNEKGSEVLNLTPLFLLPFAVPVQRQRFAPETPLLYQNHPLHQLRMFLEFSYPFYNNPIEVYP